MDREKNLRTRSRESGVSFSFGEMEASSRRETKNMRIRGNRIDYPKAVGRSYVLVSRLTIVGHFSLLSRLFIPRTCERVRDHLAFHTGRRTMNEDRKNLKFYNYRVISELSLTKKKNAIIGEKIIKTKIRSVNLRCDFYRLCEIRCRFKKS